MVTIDRIFAGSSVSRDHTSPKRTSSFSAANCGANSPRILRPAVCFAMIVLPSQKVSFYVTLLYDASVYGIAVTMNNIER